MSRAAILPRNTTRQSQGMVHGQVARLLHRPAQNAPRQHADDERHRKESAISQRRRHPPAQKGRDGAKDAGRGVAEADVCGAIIGRRELEQDVIEILMDSEGDIAG